MTPVDDHRIAETPQRHCMVFEKIALNRRTNMFIERIKALSSSSEAVSK